jgi:hypothetical protein
LPYPPNKGDKVRSYHLLRHLAAQHEVYMGTFVDDPGDEVHIPMDYCPNIDAVTWFVQCMLPKLRLRWPSLRLHTLGRSPPSVVRALAGDAVEVTGIVPDVRPYLQHAAAVVAPLLGDRTFADAIGRAARQQVRVRFGGPAQLAALNRWLNITGDAPRAA